MMACKIICFAMIGAALGLPVFFGLSFLIVMLLGGIIRSLSLDLHHLFPLYAGIAIALAGIPVGAYYGMVFALRSRGYQLGDYYRAARDFLNNT
jgi:hypothetical protein